MSIYIERETKIKLPFDYEKVIEKVVQTTMELENKRQKCEINILFVDDKAIRQINLETRGIDKETDVLSFPMIDFNDHESFIPTNPETEEVNFGDIVISIERVLHQAEEYGHSVEREFGFLIAHSMLHLLGYDHMEDEEMNLMEEKQKEIMGMIGISR